MEPVSCIVFFFNITLLIFPLTTYVHIPHNMELIANFI